MINIILCYFLFFIVGCNSTNNQYFLRNIDFHTTMKAKTQLRQNNINVDFNSLIEKTLPSVVKIHVLINEIKNVKGQQYQFYQQLATGSGFIIKDKKILTNYHVLIPVIENNGKILQQEVIYEGEKKAKLDLSVKIMVEFNSGEIFRFKIYNYDKGSDIALIEPFKKKIKYLNNVLTLADSKNVKIGNLVIAIGSPLQTFNSSSLGIISSNKVYHGNNHDIGKFAEFLQTDAAITSGNSGGPLIDLYGDVVGVISTKITENKKEDGSFQSNDISFAISSNYTKKIINELLKGKKKIITRYILDIETEEIIESILINGKKKVVVSKIINNNDFGLKIGDHITAVNNKIVMNRQNMEYYLNNEYDVCNININILRNNKIKKLTSKKCKLI